MMLVDAERRRELTSNFLSEQPVGGKAETAADGIGKSSAPQTAQQAEGLLTVYEGNVVPFGNWRTSVVPASLLGLEAAAATETDEAARAAFADRMAAVQQLALIEEDGDPAAAAEIDRRLSWRYPYADAALTPAKTSVTEMKRLHAEIGLDEDALMLPEAAGEDGSAGVMDGHVAESRHEWSDSSLDQDENRGNGALPEAALGPLGIEGGKTTINDGHAASLNDMATGGTLEQVSFDFGELESLEPGAASGTELRDGEPGEARESVRDALLREERAGSAGIPGGGGEYTFRLRRPRFMEETALTPAERGTVSHLVMQHIPLDGEGGVTEETVSRAVAGLVERRMLTKQQADAVDVAGTASFFGQEIGRRLLAAPWVRRETPFSCTLPAGRVYPALSSGVGTEPILIQGVIDCLFRDERGLVLLDYKTDRVRMGRWKEAAERHRFQLSLYAEAIASIVGRKVNECYVFFLDGGKAVKLF